MKDDIFHECFNIPRLPFEIFHKLLILVTRIKWPETLKHE